MDDFAALKQWVKEGQGTRTVEIKIGQRQDSNHYNIFAYDFELEEGQYIDTLEQLNLEKKKENNERRLYEKLRAKYEGNQ